MYFFFYGLLNHHRLAIIILFMMLFYHRIRIFMIVCLLLLRSLLRARAVCGGILSLRLCIGRFSLGCLRVRLLPYVRRMTISVSLMFLYACLNLKSSFIGLVVLILFLLNSWTHYLGIEISISEICQHTIEVEAGIDWIQWRDHQEYFQNPFNRWIKFIINHQNFIYNFYQFTKIYLKYRCINSLSYDSF